MGREIGGMLEDGSARREGVIAPGANRDEIIIGLHDVAIASNHEQRVGRCHRHDGLQFAQVPILSPIFGELYGGADDLSRILFELGLKAFKKRDAIRGRAGKPNEDFVLIDVPNLFGLGLGHCMANRGLAIRPHRYLSVFSGGHNGSGVDL